MTVKAYIGIGTNLGSKEENIRQALERIKAEERISLSAVASLYKTEPVGDVEQDWFLNTVAEIETDLSPHELLEALMSIENAMGRVRTVRWGPRVIDLDILLYGCLKIKDTELEIPHPRLEERAFVMVPLAEINPDLLLPGGSRAADLAARLLTTQQKCPLVSCFDQIRADGGFRGKF